MSSKLDRSIKFSPLEKEKLIRKYFMKYFNEEIEPQTELIEINQNLNNTSEKRKCSCTMGMYDEKTNKLIPPNNIHIYTVKTPRKFMMRVPVEVATDEMRDV
jgi:hypothetical protein